MQYVPVCPAWHGWVVVATATNDGATGVIVNVLVSILPHVAYHVQNTKRRGPGRVCINISRSRAHVHSRLLRRAVCAVISIPFCSIVVIIITYACQVTANTSGGTIIIF